MIVDFFFFFLKTIFFQTKSLLSFSIFYLIIPVNALSAARIILSYTIYLVFSINSTEKWILFQLTDRSEIHRHSSLTREHNFQKWKRLHFSWNNQINIISDFEISENMRIEEEIYLYWRINHSIVQQNIDHHRYKRRKRQWWL